MEGMTQETSPIAAPESAVKSGRVLTDALVRQSRLGKQKHRLVPEGLSRLAKAKSQERVRVLAKPQSTEEMSVGAC